MLYMQKNNKSNMNIITKKYLTIITIFLFLGLAVVPSLKSSSLNLNNEKVNIKNQSDLSVVHIEASSSYDYGYKVGKLFKPHFKLLNLFAKLSGKQKIREGYFNNQLDSMKKYCPFIFDEFRGLSTSTNINIDQLIYLKYFMFNYVNERCMSFSCTGPATKNDETILVQKRDTSNTFYKISLQKFIYVFIERYFLSRLLWVKDNGGYSSNYRYIFFGIPVLLNGH